VSLPGCRPGSRCGSGRARCGSCGQGLPGPADPWSCSWSRLRARQAVPCPGGQCGRQPGLDAVRQWARDDTAAKGVSAHRAGLLGARSAASALDSRKIDGRC